MEDNILIENAKKLYEKTFSDFYKIIETWRNSNKHFYYDDVNSLFKTCYVRNYKNIISNESYVNFGRHTFIKIQFNNTSDSIIIIKIICDIPEHVLKRSVQIKKIFDIFNSINPVSYYDLIQSKITNVKPFVSSLEEISFKSIENIKF